MKVRIIKPLRMKGAPQVQIQPGSVVELPDGTGYEWLKTGNVEIMRPETETNMLQSNGNRAPFENEPVAPVTSGTVEEKTAETETENEAGQPVVNKTPSVKKTNRTKK